MKTEKWMLALIAGMVLAAAFTIAHGSEVSWSRFKGQVKGINGKTAMLTLQNGEGDLITVKVDADVMVSRGKDDVKFSDLKMNDKEVTLLYIPRAPVPKDNDEPAEGGVYAPAKR